MSDKVEEMKGWAKEGFGKATDNERMESEGKAEKLGAQGKQKVKEGIDKVKEKVN